MSYLEKSSVLPPGFRLQVTFDENRIPHTVPVGTSEFVSFGAGLAFRNQLLIELEKLFCETYGYSRYDVRSVCFGTPEGAEVVQIHAKKPVPPKTLKGPKPIILNLPETSTKDVIDI